MAAQALPFELPKTLQMSEQGVDGKTRLSDLVREHYTFVWRNLRRLGVPHAEVDDGVQEVFLAASHRIDEIRPGTEPGFLFLACAFVAKRIRRRFARRREVSEEGLVGPVDTRADPEQRAAQSEARETLQQILDAMPDDYRDVFVLFEMEQLTTAEIATALGVPEGTVGSRLFRARRFFERAVQKQSQR